MQAVVLQLTRKHVRVSHSEPPGEGQAQGGDPTQGRPTWRDRPRMLQLRNKKCFRTWVHPSEGGQRGGAAVQAALRGSEQLEGHELGAGKLEATHH